MPATATKPARARNLNPPKLRADQARALVDAQRRYDAAKRELDAARDQRDELLTKLTPKLPVGEWIVVAGWAIRITMQRSGDRFRLSDYAKAGHKITAAMREYVTHGEAHPRLWIKPG